ncbi:MAG: hypothetical protein WCJ35_26815, partial [Planctomycetota bacterium]
MLNFSPCFLLPLLPVASGSHHAGKKYEDFVSQGGSRPGKTGELCRLWRGGHSTLFKIAIDADALSTSRSGIMEVCGMADFLNQLLLTTFAELGATGPMIRMILLKDHFFIGQRF